MKSFISIACICFMACSSPSINNENIKLLKADTNTDDTFMSTTPIPLTGCYTWVVNNDSAILKLMVERDNVTGYLKYDWHEKDDNTGTIKGVIGDSTINAFYTFQSEGKTSVRQIVFKIEGSSLIEGYGDINNAVDTVRFTDRDNLNYQHNYPFRKVDCHD